VTGPFDDPGEKKDSLRAESTTRSASDAAYENGMTTSMDPRSCILGVGASAGKLCAVANTLIPADHLNDDTENDSSEALTEALAELFASLWLTAKALRLDWVRSIRSKMALNAKKYPVEHCKGKAGKYTKYSHLTGITSTNQSTMGYRDETDDDAHPYDAMDLSLAGFAEQHLSVLADDVRIFAEERLWARYHKPRNLVLALLGEAGELAELLQWERDDWDDEPESNTDPSNSEPRLLLVDRLHSCEPEKLDELSQELADVTIYALRLATVCGLVDDLRESLVQQEPPPDLEAKQLFA